MAKTNQIKIKEKNIHGINVLYVKVPFSLNAHVGFFSLAGSYAENTKNQGVAHYLEHLFFKGTENRDLFKISDDAALLGAEQNAYTSEYDTQYYLNVPKVNVGGAIELLSDMMFNPLFPNDEIEKERSVIQEERKMYEDNHLWFFYEEVEKNFFNFQAGHKIVGTEWTIDNLNRDDILKYHKKMYGSDTTFLVIVADMPNKEIFNMCDKHLKGNNFSSNGIVPVESVILTSDNKNFVFERKNIQQTYLLGAFPGLGLSNHERAKNMCVLNALGGGMYSLLFKEIRERLGLCYSVSAFTLIQNGLGSVMSTYCQTDPENASLVKEKMIEIISNIKNNGFDKDIFECAKASQLGNFCRSTSSVSDIASIVGSIVFGHEVDFKKSYQDILDLTLDSVNEYANRNLPEIENICWAQMNPGE